MKTATIYTRIEPTIKQRAEGVFARYGLSLTDAINTFLHKSILVDGLPFDLREAPRYNAETEKVIKNAQRGKGLVGPFETFHDYKLSLES